MSILDNLTLAPMKLLHRSKAEAEKEALELLERVGLREKAQNFPCSFPADSSSVWPLCGRWPCTRM